MEKALAWIMGCITGTMFFLFGNDPVNRQWLSIVMVLVVADLVIGTVNAVMDGSFKRRLLLEGVRRKFYELLIIVIGHMLDVTNILQGAASLQKAATGFLIGYEALSLLEKIKVSGVPIPQIIAQGVKNIQAKFDADGGPPPGGVA